MLYRVYIKPQPPGLGKLAANWEGPYRLSEVLDIGPYKLEMLKDFEIPRSWNATNLQSFYS